MPHCFHQLLLTTLGIVLVSHVSSSLLGMQGYFLLGLGSPQTFPFTESSLLPLAGGAAHTRHMTMTPESG